MNTVNAPQQDNWDNNIYVISTTRVLIALGLTFLIRSVYQLFQRMRSAGANAGAAGMSRAPAHCCWKDILTKRIQSLEQRTRLGLTSRLSPWER